MDSCRLIYRSIANLDKLSNSELQKLANDAANKNRRIGIHGILVLSDGKFLQLLEGPVRFVNDLYNEIIADERHRLVELISYESNVKPEFIDWSMNLLELDKIDDDVRDLLKKKYPMVDNKFQIPNETFLMTSFLIDMKYILSN